MSHFHIDQSKVIRQPVSKLDSQPATHSVNQPASQLSHQLLSQSLGSGGSVRLVGVAWKIVGLCYWFPFGRSVDLNVPREATGAGLIFREMDSPLHISVVASLDGHEAFGKSW